MYSVAQPDIVSGICTQDWQAADGGHVVQLMLQLVSVHAPRAA
jgi:hypothetical protein